MRKLIWKFHVSRGVNVHTGVINGETYAYVFRDLDGNVGYQFKGLRGADLNSGYVKEADSVETAQKICEVMMGAWPAVH